MQRILFLCMFFCLPALCSHAQQATAGNARTPVYLRYPEVPPFSMTRPDGSVFTNKDLKKHTPTLIFLFSVDCEHCMHETEDVIKNIDRFKGTQIVMITPFRYDEMVAFYKGYGIGRYPGIIMGSDSTRRLNYFYQMHYYPGLYVYDRRDKIVFHREGTVPADSLAYYLKNR